MGAQLSSVSKSREPELLLPYYHVHKLIYNQHDSCDWLIFTDQQRFWCLHPQKPRLHAVVPLQEPVWFPDSQPLGTCTTLQLEQSFPFRNASHVAAQSRGPFRQFHSSPGSFITTCTVLQLKYFCWIILGGDHARGSSLRRVGLCALGGDVREMQLQQQSWQSSPVGGTQRFALLLNLCWWLLEPFYRVISAISRPAI